MAWPRILALFIRRRLDRELSEEIAAHLAMQEAEYRRAGMSPDEARRAAQRDFGGVAQTQESYREQRGVPWMESAARDVRYALRGLRRSPGFTVAAVLTLALGIGANTAVFSLFYSLLLKMLPVSHPEQLVTLYRTGGWSRGNSSLPLYRALRARTDLFRDVAARTGVGPVRLQTANGGKVELIIREFVSGNYFSLLGVKPVIGRLFDEGDNRVPQGHPLTVLSYDCWRNRFGADPGVLGRTLIVDDQPLTVIGVAAAGFHGVEVEHRAQVWVPIMMFAPAKQMESEGLHWLWPLARLAPGVARQHAQAAVDALMRAHLEARYGNNPNAGFRRLALEQRLEVREAAGGFSLLRDEFGRPLGVLMMAVGLLLLLACANLANLLLARGAAREREIALRYSLGASRGRLVRQSLTESLLLGAAGCGLGVLLAIAGQVYILRFLPPGAGEPFTAGLNTPVLVFSAALLLLSVILFGLAPGLRSTAIDPAEGLKVRGTGQAGHRQRLRRGLVVAQVAFSVVLAALAGLFGHSLAELRAIDPGIGNGSVIAFGLDLPSSWGKAEQTDIRERFLGRIETIPGVVSVSYSFPGPFEFNSSATATIRVPGSPRTATEPVLVQVRRIGPRQFETIGSMPIAGRDFDRNDVANARKIAIVNEAFARALLPGIANLVGRILSFDDSKPNGGEPTYIVGMVKDITHYGLRKRPEPTVYVPLVQMDPGWPPTLLVRTRIPAAALVPALRRELARLGPEVALTEPRTIRQEIDDSIFQDRLAATLSGFVGLLAVVLAAVGLYGVVAYGTARRAGEFGIRIALGACRGAVVRMVLGDALVMVSIGLALGVPGALAAGHAVASVLFGVRATDPVSLVGTAAVLGVVAVLAAWIPARRAAGMDPLRVLRME